MIFQVNKNIRYQRDVISSLQTISLTGDREHLALSTQISTVKAKFYFGVVYILQNETKQKKLIFITIMYHIKNKTVPPCVLVFLAS